MNWELNGGLFFNLTYSLSIIYLQVTYSIFAFDFINTMNLLMVERISLMRVSNALENQLTLGLYELFIIQKSHLKYVYMIHYLLIRILALRREIEVIVLIN